MFIEQYRSLVQPYTNAIDTEYLGDLVNLIDITDQLRAAPSILTKNIANIGNMEGSDNADILGYMEAHDIDPNLYRYCITFPISSSHFDPNTLDIKLLFNGKSVNYWSDLNNNDTYLTLRPSGENIIQDRFGNMFDDNDEYLGYDGPGMFPIIKYDDEAYKEFPKTSKEYKFIKRYLADHHKVRRYGKVVNNKPDEYDDDEINANLFKEQDKFKFRNSSNAYLKYKFAIIYSHIYIFSINRFQDNETLHLYTTKLRNSRLLFSNTTEHEEKLILPLKKVDDKLVPTFSRSSTALAIYGKYIKLNKNQSLDAYLKDIIEEETGMRYDVLDPNMVISFIVHCGVYMFVTTKEDEKENDIIPWVLTEIKSTNPMYVLYNGKSVHEWIHTNLNDKYDVLYQEDFDRFLKLTNNTNKEFIPKYKDLYKLTDLKAYNTLVKDKYRFARYIRDLNYDLFIEWNKKNTKLNDRIYYATAEKVKTTYGGLTHRDVDTGLPEINRYIKLPISNFHHQPVDIYINGLFYSGPREVEREHHWDYVYISLLNIRKFFQYNSHLSDLVTYDDFVYTYKMSEETWDNIYFDIIKRDHDHKMVSYQNITDDYNGVLIPGNEILSTSRKVYDNGYFIGDEYDLTDLPPTHMIAMFPKYQMKKHAIDVTYTSSPKTYYSKTYTRKFRNFLNQDIVDAEYGYQSLLINNLLWVDYIDYRFTLNVNGTLMFNEIHYDILAPNLILFKTKPWVLPEDDVIDITVEYQGMVEPELLTTYKNTSLLYKMYNESSVIDSLYQERNNSFEFEIYNELDKYIAERYPVKYDEEIFRHHQFLTKYFSTEMTLEGNATSYGYNWLHSMIYEFPEFVYYIGLENKLRWKEIMDINKPWSYWDNLSADEINALFNVSKNYLIDTNIPHNVLKYPERLSNRDEEFENKLKELKNKIKRKEASREDIRDFNEEYGKPLVEIDNKTGLPIRTIRFFNPLAKPRDVILPEKTPLNILLTNHMVFVNNYYDKMKHLKYYYEFSSNFDNDEIIDKNIYGYEALDTLRANIIPSLIEEDSKYVSTIPVNYLIDDTKYTINEKDKYYIENDPISVKPLEKEIRRNHVLHDPIKPHEIRYINIIPTISEAMMSGRVTIPESEVILEFNVADNKPLSLKDLLLKNNFVIDDIIEYVYLDEGKTKKVDINADLKKMTDDFIGYSFKDPIRLVPKYKSYNLTINMGVSNTEVTNIDALEYKLRYDIPYKDHNHPDLVNFYPHLKFDGITLNKIAQDLFNKYRINITDLVRYGDTPKLYDNKRVVFEFTDDNIFKPKLSKSILLDYYGEEPNPVELEAKVVRIFDLGESKASLMFNSPKFILPYKNDFKEYRYEYTEFFTNLYKDNEGIPFMEYMISPTFINPTNRITETNIYSMSETEVNKYKKLIYDQSWFNTYINHNNKKESIYFTFNNFKYNRKMVIKNDLDLYIDENLRLWVVNIKTGEKFDTLLPPYIDSKYIGNITIASGIFNKTSNHNYYAYSLEDVENDSNYSNKEIIITDRFDRTIYQRATAVSMLYMDRDDLVVYIEEDPNVFKEIYNINTEITENIYKDIHDKAIIAKKNLYYYDRISDKKYRMLDKDVFLYYLYEKLNYKDKVDSVYFEKSETGRGDINFTNLYERYNIAKDLDIDEDLILKWQQAFGYLRYSPTRMNYRDFRDSENIDITLKHDGFRLEVVLEDEYHVRYVKNRKDNTDYFMIKGDENFINIVKSETDSLIKFYIDSRLPNEFELSNVTIIDPYRKNSYIVPDEYKTRLLDTLFFAGSIDPNTGLRLMSQVPIVRIQYKIKQGTVKDIPEVLNNEEMARNNFYNNNFIGLRTGIGNNLYLKEYKFFFENTPINTGD